jgi:hypothetical protein
MPFTFSHPAAILPLNHFFKRHVSTTGLVAGSLVPDFEYFVRVYHQSFYTHTWGGLFYTDLPAGVLLCFLYHNLIRRPLYDHAPLVVKQKLAPFQLLNWNRWAVERWRTVSVCVLLGAFTHLLWDKLTHHTVPLLHSASGFQNFYTEGDRLTTYLLFWHLSSIAGAVLVLYTLWSLPSDKTVKPNKSICRYWICFFACVLILFLLQRRATNVEVLDNVVITAINSLLLSLVLTSALFAIRFRAGNNKFALAGKK